MKIIKVAVLSFILSTNMKAQENLFSVSTVRHSNWTYLQFNLSHQFKNRFEIGGGLGLNCSPLLQEGTFNKSGNISYHPSPKGALEYFTINYKLKKYLDFQVENCQFYLSLGQTFAYSSFKYNRAYALDSIIYLEPYTSSPYLYFIQNINLGAQIQLKPRCALFSSVGLNYIVNKGGNDKLNFIFELGVNLQLRKKEEK